MALICLRVQPSLRGAEVEIYCFELNWLQLFLFLILGIILDLIRLLLLLNLVEWDTLSAKVQIFVHNVRVREVCPLHIGPDVPDCAIHHTLVKCDCLDWFVTGLISKGKPRIELRIGPV